MTKKMLLVALVGLFVLPSFAPANGFNLNGLGSRAQGLGGAFVSIANDFSAVFWNPAGAAGFRQATFGFYATDLIPRATYRFESTIPEVPIIDAKTKVSHYLGFLAGCYKPVSSKIVVGLGIATPSAQGTLWNGADFTSLSDGVAYDWSSRMYVFSFSPLVAVKLSDAVSLGATLNLNYGSFSLKMPGGNAFVDDQTENYVDIGQYEENMNGWGFGATFGVLIKPVDKLSIGLTVRTPSTVSFNGSASLSNLSVYGLPVSSELKRKITWPLWIAGGVSFRPVERLLLSADVHWTQWSKLDRITTEFLESAWIRFNANVAEVRILEWKDTFQLRFGAEFILSDSIALRAGYYHDPAPAPVDRLTILYPSHTFNAFSIGAGKTIGGLQLDFGLEYLAGDKRQAASLFFDLSGMPGTFGLHVVVPTASVSYKF